MAKPDEKQEEKQEEKKGTAPKGPKISAIGGYLPAEYPTRNGHVRKDK